MESTRAEEKQGSSKEAALLLGFLSSGAEGSGASLTPLYLTLEERLRHMAVHIPTSGEGVAGARNRILIPLLTRSLLLPAEIVGTQVVLDTRSPVLRSLLAEAAKSAGRPFVLLDPFQDEHSLKVEPLWGANSHRLHRIVRLLINFERQGMLPRLAEDPPEGGEDLLLLLLRIVRMLPRARCSLAEAERIARHGVVALEEAEASVLSTPPASEVLRALRILSNSAASLLSEEREGREGREEREEREGREGREGREEKGRSEPEEEKDQESGDKTDSSSAADLSEITRAVELLGRTGSSSLHLLGKPESLREETLLSEIEKVLQERQKDRLHLTSDLISLLSRPREHVEESIAYAARCLSPFGISPATEFFSRDEACMGELLTTASIVVLGASRSKMERGSALFASLLLDLTVEALETISQHPLSPEDLKPPTHILLEDVHLLHLSELERWPRLFPTLRTSLTLFYEDPEQIDRYLVTGGSQFRSSLGLHISLEGDPDRVSAERSTEEINKLLKHAPFYLFERGDNNPLRFQSSAFYQDPNLLEVLGLSAEKAVAKISEPEPLPTPRPRTQQLLSAEFRTTLRRHLYLQRAANSATMSSAAPSPLPS